MAGRVLVLGASGRLGCAAAEAFRDAGWSVRSLVRASAAARIAPNTELIEIDARDRDSVIEAAQGCDLVLHALNLPYADWRHGALELAQTAIAAAERNGATLLFPGNLYNFGSPLPSLINETTPQRPTSRKGQIRVAMEQAMQRAADRGLRTIVLRAGDFIGGGPGTWLDRVILRNAGRHRLTYPGPLDAMHEWAYVPDLAAAFVRVAERRDHFSGFTPLCFEGHAVTGQAFVHALARLFGHGLGVDGMPWRLMRMLSPIVPIFRELSELAYLWEEAHRLDGSRLASLIGAIPRTPFEVALAAALHALDPRGPP